MGLHTSSSIQSQGWYSGFQRYSIHAKNKFIKIFIVDILTTMLHVVFIRYKLGIHLNTAMAMLITK